MEMWFESALLPGGWAKNVRIAVAGGRIASVDSNVHPPANDERHAIGLPGLSNLHSHGFQRGMSGLTERRGPAADTFWTWRRLMYHFLDRMTPEDIAAITAQAYVEMLETGFTRVGEFHYVYHDPAGQPYQNRSEMAERVAEAAAITGINLTLLPVFYAHGGFGGRPPSPGQRRFLTDLDQFARLVEDAGRIAAAVPGGVMGIAPHSLRAVTAGQLSAVIQMSAGQPIHIHAAEQTAEVEECLAWSGARPVEWLLANAPVDERWCLIHATHLDQREISGLARSGAIAGLCPVTEANLGDGVFPAAQFAAAGGKLGVGTDSNILIDAASELRGLEYSQRLTLRERNVMARQEGHSTGEVLFQAALAGGAQALGAGPAGLVEGAWADMLSLDPEHVSIVGLGGDAVLDGWIFAGRAGVLDRVWSRGDCRVIGGRHISRDAVAAGYRRTVCRLLESF